MTENPNPQGDDPPDPELIKRPQGTAQEEADRLGWPNGGSSS